MPPVNTLRDVGASGLVTPDSPASVSSSVLPGPGHRLTLALVARRHYLEGRSKVEIAQETGLSRFKVARLIEEARQSGVVRIEIVEDPEIDVEASVRLRSALGLTHVVVVPAVGEPRDVRTRLGEVAARLTTELISPDDVLGLPWSRSVDAMVRHLAWLPPIEVVQLCGAAATTDTGASAVEVVVRAARLAATPGHVFFAPLVVSDAATAAALRREPQVRQALDRGRDVTVAVVGVGAWGPGLSTIHDASEPVAREQAREAGVIGEIAGVFFDERGRLVEPELRRRIVGVSGDDLVRIPRVVALAAGAERAGAVAAAAQGGIIDALVTDSALATELLDGV